MQIPAVPAQIQAVVSKGAPLAISVPDYTTGIEMQIILTASAKARHPNASRLFTNYVMSREGNEDFNADAGSVTVYDTTRLPKNYQNPRYSAIARKEELSKLLGF